MATMRMPARSTAICRGRPTTGGNDPEHELDAGPDEEDVRDRPDAGLLAQRDPQQEHEEADDVRDPADADAGVDRQTLGEHGPRIDAQTGLDRQGAAGPVEEEPDQQLEHSTCHETIQSQYWTARSSPI